MGVTAEISCLDYEDEYRLIAQQRGAAPEAEFPLITDKRLRELPDGSLKAVILGWLAPESTTMAKTLISQATYPIALKHHQGTNQYKLMVADA